MTSCRNRSMIDDYLLGRLDDAQATRFEEHYFDCHVCTEELKSRWELMRVIKDRGRVIFDRPMTPVQESGKAAKAGGSFRFRPWWALAGLAAAAGLTFLVVLRPQRPAQPPAFTLNGDNTVRGPVLELLSPRQTVERAPEVFEWKPLARSASYALTLYDKDVIWSERTSDSRLAPPEEVKALMRPGRTYAWEVKAYSPQGALIRASGPVQFRIAED